MGAVYLGEHLLMGRKDAIKVLKTSIERDPDAVARFTRGARNASSIRHANVCTVYDFGQTADGRPFLAMEFVEGEELGRVLAREGALPPERCVEILTQVADAVQAAHERGIVHRDLKPGNIMLGTTRGGSDHVKVVDFDIAKEAVEAEATEVTRLGLVVGTPEYMSPEQLTGDRLDGRSDVYSLGVILFKMLTGSLPHQNDSTHEMMVARLTTPPSTLAETAPGTAFPPGLQTVLDRSLARKRDERFESAEAFRAALAGSLGTPGGVAEELPATVAASVPTQAMDVPATTRAPEIDQEGAEAPDGGGRPWALWAGVPALVAVAVVAVTLVIGGAGDLTVQVDPAMLTLFAGSTAQLSATAMGSDGEERQTGSPAWSSDSPGVATVDAEGRIRALRPGQARITAEIDGAATAAFVTVEALPPLVVEPASLEFAVRLGGSAPQPREARIDLGRLALAEVRGDVDAAAAGWLHPAVTRGDAGWTLSVTITPAGLTEGRHEATVRVTGRTEEAGQSVFTDVPVVATVSRNVEPPPPEIQITAADAGDITYRQFERVDADDVDLRGVRDTLEAVLDLSSLDTETRSFAAYTYALVLQKQGNGEAALRWAREAAALDPGNAAYQQLLAALRRDP